MSVQEANGSVGLCDDGIDVSLQEGFWFEYRLLHSVRSKIRSDLRKEKKKLQVKSFKQKRSNLSTNDPSFSSLLSVCDELSFNYIGSTSCISILTVFTK